MARLNKQGAKARALLQSAICPRHDRHTNGIHMDYEVLTYFNIFGGVEQRMRRQGVTYDVRLYPILHEDVYRPPPLGEVIRLFEPTEKPLCPREIGALVEETDPNLCEKTYLAYREDGSSWETGHLFPPYAADPCSVQDYYDKDGHYLGVLRTPVEPTPATHPLGLPIRLGMGL